VWRRRGKTGPGRPFTAAWRRPGGAPEGRAARRETAVLAGRGVWKKTAYLFCLPERIWNRADGYAGYMKKKRELKVTAKEGEGGTKDAV